MITVSRITDVEKYLNGIDGVIFDLDDTLYSEKQYVKSGYRKIAAAFPQIEAMEEKLWACFLNRQKAIDTVLENEGIYTIENVVRCVEIYRFQAPEIDLYEGVREMLLRIKASGKKLGMITDGRSEGQRAKIEALRLAPLFDEIIVTDELGGIEFRKPCEKAFILLAERLGVSLENSVYIGDNPNKDFIAPEKLGMKSVWFQNADGIYYNAERR
ncbi:MAG: HAD-IA family hydrolase [Clostridia bacterium]|nr:HAD-IA family hydrolase [Clostridia bacterium]